MKIMNMNGKFDRKSNMITHISNDCSDKLLNKLFKYLLGGFVENICRKELNFVFFPVLLF